MNKYKIPVSWSVCGIMEVEANSLEDAIDKAEDMPLPTDTDYIDGSFEVNRDMLEYYNENGLTIE